MRNTKFLDNPQPVDQNIGELQSDEHGTFRTINGKKIYQIEEKTQDDIDKNTSINRCRASGMRPSEYLRSLYN